MKLVPTSLKLDSSYPVPRQITQRRVDGRNLLIAPDVPAWTVLDEAGSDVVLRLSRGATLREAIDCMASWGVADARHAVSELLAKLAIDGFREDAETTNPAESEITLQLHLTNACNLRCKHCYVSSGEAFPEEIGLDGWKKIIDVAAARYQTVYVSLSGGEPLLVPWLPELLEHAKGKGAPVAMISNGMLWTERRANELGPLLNVVKVSLDGASADVHDRIRGPGSFRQAVRGISRLGAAGVEVGVNVVLMKSNLDDVVENLPSLVRSFPFKVSVSFGKFVDEGRGSEISSEAPPASALSDALLALARDFLSSGWAPTNIPRRSNCGFGRSFAVYANGDVSPCLSPRYIAGNALREPTEAIFDRVRVNAANGHVDKLPLCRTCDLRYLCGGKCHLDQLRSNIQISQNACSADYRAAFYKKLVVRAETQDRITIPLLKAS
jgi:radical SAM protein with 4Fe4S-binding SPASM domain